MTSDWGQARGAGRELTRVQIYKHISRDRVLDISDMLNVEPRRSKIAFTLLEFDEHYKAKSRVRHYVDARDFKLVCWDILHSTFTEWDDHKGGKSGDGFAARALILRRDLKYRQPFVLKIDNGEGEPCGNGTVRMVRATETLTMLLSDHDARKMAQTVLDYVRDWETVNFRRRQEAQCVILTLPGEDERESGESRQRMAVAA